MLTEGWNGSELVGGDKPESPVRLSGAHRSRLSRGRRLLGRRRRAQPRRDGQPNDHRALRTTRSLAVRGRLHLVQLCGGTTASHQLGAGSLAPKFVDGGEAFCFVGDRCTAICSQWTAYLAPDVSWRQGSRTKRVVGRCLSSRILPSRTYALRSASRGLFASSLYRSTGQPWSPQLRYVRPYRSSAANLCRIPRRHRRDRLSKAILQCRTRLDTTSTLTREEGEERGA